MHQIRFRLGLRPRPRCGAYSAPPDLLAGFGGPLRGRGGAGLKKRRGGKGARKGRRGKWRGGKGRAPKLLLNHGPSEPCYATGAVVETGMDDLLRTWCKRRLQRFSDLNQNASYYVGTKCWFHITISERLLTELFCDVEHPYHQKILR